MRFKKLIAAGASFLLVVGASTLGAAAAYADDAPVTDPVVTETAPEPAPEPDPAPAPEPVVETAPETVPEPEPAPEPVVEPSTDPVESAPPSTESDSDPPAETGTDSTESGFTAESSEGDSGDAPVTFSALKLGFAESSFAEGNEDNQNEVVYWQNLYPDTTCYKDNAAYGSITNGGKAVTLVAGTYVVLIVNSGSVDSGDGPGNKVYPNPVAGTAYYPPLNNGGQQGNVSHWIVCIANGEENEDIPVTPAAVPGDQTCDEAGENLVGGTIQLTLLAGVNYTITGPGAVNVPFDGTGLASGLAPGDYDVTFTIDPGYSTSVTSPIEITIGAFGGECGEIDDECETDTRTAGLSALNVDEDCEEEDCPAEGNSDGQNNSCLPSVYLCHATSAVPGVNDYNGLILPVAGALGHVFPPPAQDHDDDIIPPFDYYEGGVLKHFDGRNWDPSIDPDSEFWHNLVANDCVEQDEVTPGAQKVDETCENLILVGGSIQVTVIAGVTYTVTGPNGVVPLDGSGNTGPIDPGNYSVAFVLDPSLTTSVVSPILLTINAFDGDCELIEHPLVTPAVTSSALSCLDLGSYTLSNDLNDPMAILWTVNGNPLGVPLTSPSQFSVTSPGVYNIHAEANGPDYGLNPGDQQDWTLTFVDAEDCDLATLALTGQSPNAFIGGAMVLILTGLAMFRLRTARREKMTLI
jgi:hypothetical protein